MDSPEVLAVIGDLPHLSDFLNGIYECNYKHFFTAMGTFMFGSASKIVICSPLLL